MKIINGIKNIGNKEIKKQTLDKMKKTNTTVSVEVQWILDLDIWIIKYSSTAVIKTLEANWFEKKSQKWSHAKYVNNDWKTVIVPIHKKKDIAIWTLSSICKQAWIEKSEFITQMRWN